MAGRPEPKPVTVKIEPATIENTTDVPPTPSRGDSGGFQSLADAWNSFADALKTEDTRLFSILTAHTPTLEDETKIIFQISNPLQKEPLQKIQPRLLQYLRSALNNENTEMEIVLSEKNETTKAYTAEDKFAQMSRKNPVLLTFKQQFGLDFE